MLTGEQGAHYRVCQVAVSSRQEEALPIVQRSLQWGSGRREATPPRTNLVPRRQTDCTRHHAAGGTLDIFLDVTTCPSTPKTLYWPVLIHVWILIGLASGHILLGLIMIKLIWKNTLNLDTGPG